MRWIAAGTVAVLLLCTVIACTGVAAELARTQETQTPPCHQHQKPVAPQAASSCDHQQAVTTESMAMPAPAAAWLPPASPASPLAGAPQVPGLPVIFAGLPGPAVPSSVLRI